MASQFEQALSQYDDQEGVYQERLSNYKDLLRQAKEQPKALAKQLAGEIASPFLAHVFSNGISKTINGLRAVASGDGSEATLDDLVSRAGEVADGAPVTVPDVSTATDGALDALDSARAGAEGLAAGVRDTAGVARDTLQNLLGQTTEMPPISFPSGGSSLAEAAQSALAGAPESLAGALDSASGALDLPSVTSGAAKATSFLDKLATRFRGKRAPETDPDSIFGLQGTEDVDPEVGNIALDPEQLAQPGGGLLDSLKSQARNLFNTAKQNIQDVVSSGTDTMEQGLQSAVQRFVPAGLQDDAQAAADRLSSAVRGNIQEVMSAADVDFDTAQSALQSGAKALIKGQDKFTGLNSEGYELQPDTEGLAGVDTAEEAVGDIAATGAEDFGLSDVVAGLAGLGILLGTEFAGKHHLPEEVPLPNIAIPTFQVGVDTG